ncbi:SoxR reducing system RseC family protein [Vibrio parahaemolyticus]|uniref:SoxR reducing system RseC family protein n=1 Tax=Vibrio mediterranei TaxID=689 RepID=UPI0040682495
MMTALATVVSVQSRDHRFQVELSCDQQTSCSSCQSKSSCGTGIVSKAVGKKQLHWQLSTTQSVKQGDVVEIAFPEKSLLQSAALIYLMPLFFLFIGALLGQFWLAPMVGGGELSVIICSAVFAFAGFLLARRWVAPMEQASVQQVALVRVLGQSIV